MTIRCLLVEPNPDSALDAEASRLMQEDWERYEETARLWTSVHASERPACFEDNEVEAATKLQCSRSWQARARLQHQHQSHCER